MWREVKKEKPPEGVVVDTKVDDEKGERNNQKLLYSHNLWWFPNMEMYVYYTPTHWRHP